MSLSLIHEHLNKYREQIDSYFNKQFLQYPPPLYVSCDIRHAGDKIAVVDTNLFPAGFNNLCHSYTQQASESFLNYFTQYYPQVKKILILPEAHTRNRFYFENIAKLSSILSLAKFEVKVGLLPETIENEDNLVHLDFNANQGLDLERVSRTNNKLISSSGFCADIILSNQDFSSGVPEILHGLEQKIIPSPSLGWHQRKKSTHFNYYNQIAKEVADILQIDPWLISTFIDVNQEVDLQSEESLKKLANQVDQLLLQIEKKHQEYKIDSAPYLFIKNNSGTYGMAVTYVMSGDEILNMNRRLRNKMLSAKGGSKVEEFILQEGLKTVDSYSGYPIEPVIYLVGQTPIGGFFRINEERDEWSSLNTKGMAFSCLCLHKLDEPHEGRYLNCQEKKNLIEVSKLISRIAVLAAAYEEKNIEFGVK